ncbi:hypothetical protein AVEN_218268-1 [Araneus ventricosus]|uniref:Peptidase M12A domain-containing protein n=1 Tax=Araneus ventricosus TaxID=182803 RepID=A0A4Y2T649_ARAVE|nr:hypothetical protein AVEN_218268-1 [Araneus ventricosus]
MDELIRQNRRITTRKIAVELSISKVFVHHIINKKLGYGKVCAQWVPKHLSENQKTARRFYVRCAQAHFRTSLTSGISAHIVGMEPNLEKLSHSQNILLSPFDYDSIMIYGNEAFSKDGKSHTLDAKNGQKLLYPYNKSGMTESDIQRVKMLCPCRIM